ncbi:MAG: SAM-dependent methyltransferase [Bacteroidota bacterium]
MNDPFGQAIKEYFEKGKAPDIQVNSNYTEGESIPASYFFRTKNEMPETEQAALKKCRGKILDIGAAAGAHSLILQKKGYNVTALEKSELAGEVMKKRGIVKTLTTDIHEFNGKQFDSILLLMNGAGIGGTIDGLKKLLAHLKTLLTEKGQVLIDSSDIKYLFEEDDGSQWVDLASQNYYGEMKYTVTFRNSSTEFDWLFIDFETLTKIANEVGFTCKPVLKGDHYDYLAQLKI